MSLAPRPSTARLDGSDRRASPRIPAAAVPYLIARVEGGPPVRLIDLSKRGVQVETPLKMPPGSTVTIRFVSGHTTVTLNGAVVRSTVSVVETGGAVTYHTALAFTDELTMCGEELEAAFDADRMAWSRDPVADTSANYTMIVLDGRTGETWSAGSAAVTSDIFR